MSFESPIEVADLMAHTLWEAAEDQDEPVFHVKWDDQEFYGGWQGFIDWVVIWRPTTIVVSGEWAEKP